MSRTRHLSHTAIALIATLATLAAPAAYAAIAASNTLLFRASSTDVLRLTNAGLTVSGTISTTSLFVNGVQITSGGGGGTSDRIVSTSANVVAGNGGTVSFTTGGVSGTAYFDTTGRLVAPGISLTTANGISSSRAYITTAMGLGTTTPAVSLSVIGEVQVSSSGITCNSARAGAIRYSAGSLSVCNGTAFTAIGSGGASADPVSASGAVFRTTLESPGFSTLDIDTGSGPVSTLTSVLVSATKSSNMAQTGFVSKIEIPSSDSVVGNNFGGVFMASARGTGNATATGLVVQADAANGVYSYAEGLRVRATKGTTTTGGGAFGAQIEAYGSNTGQTDELTGLYVSANNNAGGTTDTAYGISTYMDIGSTNSAFMMRAYGSVTNGVDVGGANIQIGAQTASNLSLYQGILNVGPDVASSVGLGIVSFNESTSGQHFGIFQAADDSAALTTTINLLSSPLGIGKEPAYQLDVSGTINATEILINGSPISGGGGSGTLIGETTELNTLLGFNAGSNGVSFGVTFIGSNAGADNVSSFATGVGGGALQGGNTADGSTAIGTFSMSANTTGIANTGVGMQSLMYNSTGLVIQQSASSQVQGKNLTTSLATRLSARILALLSPQAHPTPSSALTQAQA